MIEHNLQFGLDGQASEYGIYRPATRYAVFVITSATF
jgi:hypothetical protein